MDTGVLADRLTVVTDQDQTISARLAALEARRSELGVSIDRLSQQAGYRAAQSWYDLQAGKRPVSTLEKFERALDYIEEHAHEVPAEVVTSVPDGLIEFEITGDFGVRAVVRGPVANVEELERAAERILDRIRRGQGQTE